MHTIDNQDICLCADHEAANIVPHQRFGATHRPGMENIACRSRIAVMFRDAAENSSLAYILYEVVGNCVGSDPHHYPHVDVMTVNLHICPIAHERGWTVRHAGPAVAENFDIVPAVPAGPVTAIWCNHVPQDSAFIQKTALNQELYRRPGHSVRS